MKLLTKEIAKKAKSQFEMGSSLSQKVVAKFFNPCGSWTWYLLNMDDDEDYCWGIVKGYAIEEGSFSLKELQSIKLKFGLGIERDLYFKEMTARELLDKLLSGEHV